MLCCSHSVPVCVQACLPDEMKPTLKLNLRSRIPTAIRQVAFPSPLPPSAALTPVVAWVGRRI